MGYHLEVNALLVVPSTELDLKTVEVGKVYSIIKKNERLYPLSIPMEFCDEHYRYYGKGVVSKLTLEKNKTTLTFEVVRLFSKEDSEAFSRNFIDPGTI